MALTPLSEFDRITLARTPRNDGIYLYSHPHVWREIGATQWTNGSWSAVFQCLVCPDVVTSDDVIDREVTVVD
jgi:hypothetical protein